MRGATASTDSRPAFTEGITARLRTAQPVAIKFSGKYSHRILKGIGHNEPCEAPQVFAQAVVEVDG
jgi:hypothetical protein